MAASRTAPLGGTGGVEMGQPDSFACPNPDRATPDVPPHATQATCRAHSNERRVYCARLCGCGKGRTGRSTRSINGERDQVRSGASELLYFSYEVTVECLGREIDTPTAKDLNRPSTAAPSRARASPRPRARGDVDATSRPPAPPGGSQWQLAGCGAGWQIRRTAADRASERAGRTYCSRLHRGSGGWRRPSVRPAAGGERVVGIRRWMMARGQRRQRRPTYNAMRPGQQAFFVVRNNMFWC